MRRFLSTLAIASALIAPSIASAADTAANTPKLALHRAELWLSASEPKPSVADLDAGMGVAAAAEERMMMLHTEMSAASSRRRTLMVQAVAARKKIAELRAEQASAKAGENGIKKSGLDAKIVELTQKAEALDAQAETMFSIMHRIGEEENGIVDVIGRVNGLAELIRTSSTADAKQKQKAAALTTKTTRTFSLHASMIMTLTAAQ